MTRPVRLIVVSNLQARAIEATRRSVLAHARRKEAE